MILTVADKEIDLEIALIRSVDGYAYSGMDYGKNAAKNPFNTNFEKVLTKDVVIKEDAIKNYYKENSSIFNTVTTYRTAVIIVPSKGEAEQALDELSKGSSFDVLAKERSTDLASGSLGGDIGYLNASTDAIDPAIVDTAIGMKEGATSDVVALDDGSYAIIRVSEVMEGQSFDFKEVKEHIQRELAMEQLTQSVSPEHSGKNLTLNGFMGNEKAVWKPDLTVFPAAFTLFCKMVTY